VDVHFLVVPFVRERYVQGTRLLDGPSEHERGASYYNAGRGGRVDGGLNEYLRGRKGQLRRAVGSDRGRLVNVAVIIRLPSRTFGPAVLFSSGRANNTVAGGDGRGCINFTTLGHPVADDPAVGRPRNTRSPCVDVSSIFSHPPPGPREKRTRAENDE